MTTDQIPRPAARRGGARSINGATVAALRHARGLQQGELARRAGRSPGYVSKLEGGSRRIVTTDKAASLAAALDVSLEVLTGQRPVLGILRHLHGLAPDVLAADVGISAERLGALENGADLPTMALRAVLANRIGVDAAALGPCLDEVS